MEETQTRNEWKPKRWPYYNAWNKKWFAIILMIMVVLLVFILQPWRSREDILWSKTLRKDQLSSYSHYLEKYPRGQYHKEALDSLVSKATEVFREEGFPIPSEEQSITEKPAGHAIAPGAQKVLKQTEGGMVSIQGGSFQMGSPGSESGRGNDEQQHKVSVSGFAISRYEVTYDQYDAFCKATGRVQPNDNGWGRGKRPVTNVSWHDASAYCQWLTKNSHAQYRLPTEAEWEYACRGGSTSPFSSGPCLDTKYANYNGRNPHFKCPKGENRKQTLPSGSLRPNPRGLFDMHGNVLEWCSDWYASDYYQHSPTRNPKGPEKGGFKVIRGGSWAHYGVHARSAARDHRDPSSKSRNLGFRVVRSR